MQTWILDGQPIDYIRDAVAQIYPKANAEQLIAQATRTFAAIAREPEDLIRGWCMAATRDLYRKMNSVGDYVGALRAVQVLDRLAGATKPAPKDLEI